MSSSLEKTYQTLLVSTALLLLMQGGLVAKAKAQNADAEVHVIGFTQIKCTQRRKPAHGSSGYDMVVECFAQVSGIIKYVYPHDVRYKITARINRRGYDEGDLPVGEQPWNEYGLTAMGTGKVSVPVRVKTSVPIEPWNREVDY